MSRDMRDPGLCGLAYLKARGIGVKPKIKPAPIELAANIRVRNYEDTPGWISADPAEHHSKVDQTLQNDDGGAS